MNAVTRPRTASPHAPSRLRAALRELPGWLAYVAVRVAGGLLGVFPIEANLRTARAIGWCWYRWPRMPRWAEAVQRFGAPGRLAWKIVRTVCRLGEHRERAAEHLRLAYGDAFTESQRQRIVRESMQHWVMVYAMELPALPRLITPWSWRRYVRLNNVEPAVRVLLDRRGCIMLTPHYGNFEVLGYALAMLGFPITALMRPLDNQRLNDYLVRTRRRSGIELLFKKGAAARAPEVLQSGGALCFIADQDAGRKGIFVEFFGRPASTYKSIGLLAMEYQAPIVVGCARRIGRGFQYEIHVERVIDPKEWADRPDELRWITQEFSSAMERLIRAAPEQYLWIHRRWKSQPRISEPATTRIR